MLPIVREAQAGWGCRSVSRWRASLPRVPAIPEPRHSHEEMSTILADVDGRRFPLRTGFVARESPRKLEERANGGFTSGETRDVRRILRRAARASRKLFHRREASGTDSREGQSRAPVQREDARLSSAR